MTRAELYSLIERGLMSKVVAILLAPIYVNGERVYREVYLWQIEAAFDQAEALVAEELRRRRDDETEAKQ